MRKIAIATVFLAGLAMTSTALADPPIGSRLGNRLRASAEDIKVEEAARRGHEFAACLTNKRASGVVKLLAQQTEAAYESAYKSLMGGELMCYTGFTDDPFIEGRAFVMPRELMRGMLAEELIKRNEKAIAALPALPRQQLYSRPWYAATGRHVAVDEMATCISETVPGATLALLHTRAYTPEEKAAFGALTPHFGVCLSAGAKLVANRQSMRAALADALYQRLINPPAPIPAPPAAAPKPTGTTQ